jgi:hypothetical protein
MLFSYNRASHYLQRYRIRGLVFLDRRCISSTPNTHASCRRPCASTSTSLCPFHRAIWAAVWRPRRTSYRWHYCRVRIVAYCIFCCHRIPSFRSGAIILQATRLPSKEQGNDILWNSLHYGKVCCHRAIAHTGKHSQPRLIGLSYELLGMSFIFMFFSSSEAVTGDAHFSPRWTTIQL